MVLLKPLHDHTHSSVIWMVEVHYQISEVHYQISDIGSVSSCAMLHYSWAHGMLTVTTNWPSGSVGSKMMSSLEDGNRQTHNALWEIEGSVALANELWDYRCSLLDCAYTHSPHTLALWQIEHNPHLWATASDSRDSKTMTYRACQIKVIPLFTCLQHLHIKTV